MAEKKDILLGSKLPQLSKGGGLKPFAKPLGGNSMPKIPSIIPPKKSISSIPAIPALQSSAAGIQAPIPEFQNDDGSSTQALSQPSHEELEKAILQSQGGPCISEDMLSEPLALSSSIDFGDSPSNINQPSMPSAPVEPQAPQAPAEPSAAPSQQPNEPSAPANPQPTIALSEPVKLNQSSDIPSSSFDNDDAPLFGGAASENNDLQFEDEGLDDLGEKTMMLDAAPDDELEDIGNEKTQISLSCMDYDPLSGKLIVESGKTSQREYILVREKTTIGRSPDNDITISDIAMSRKHVEINKFPEGFRLRDLESGNGTVLNGYRIRVGQLRDGDIIEIGNIRFRFEQTGGDPDELWKGEPKIEYHPNQKNGVVPPSRTSPAQSRNNAPRPVSQPPAFNSAPEPPSPPQVSETMLERQGGGIAAPSWAGASPMTAPYMGAINPSMLRNLTTPPAWALPVVLVLSLILIITAVWAIIAIHSYKNCEAIAADNQKLVANISDKFTKSNDECRDGGFETAKSLLADARKLDVNDAVIKDTNFFDFYDEFYAKELDLNNEIEKINEKKYNINNQDIEKFEKDLDFLKNDIPNSSTFNRSVADRVYSAKLTAYQKTLRNVIDNNIKENRFDDAQELIKKLSKFPEQKREVRTLKKKLADKEKQS